MEMMESMDACVWSCPLMYAMVGAWPCVVCAIPCVDRSPPLFYRGRKLGEHGYFMISVTDNGSALEFRAYDPRTTKSYTRVVGYSEANALVRDDAKLTADRVLLGKHLARRLVIDASEGGVALEFGPGAAVGM